MKRGLEKVSVLKMMIDSGLPTLRSREGLLRPPRIRFFPDPLFLILQDCQQVLPRAGQPVFLQAAISKPPSARLCRDPCGGSVLAFSI